MNLPWQNVAATLIVLVATLYLLARLIGVFGRDRPCGFGYCRRCSAKVRTNFIQVELSVRKSTNTPQAGR